MMEEIRYKHQLKSNLSLEMAVTLIKINDSAWNGRVRRMNIKGNAWNAEMSIYL